MKRVITFVLSVVTVAVLFCSCGVLASDPITKELNKADKKMNGLDSYTCEAKTEISMPVGYSTVTVEETNTVIITDQHTEDFVYTNKGVVTSGGITSLNTLDAYKNGKMYKSYVGDGISSRLCSEITKKDYLKFTDSLSASSEFDVNSEEFYEKNVENQDDGSIKLYLSGCSSQMIEGFLSETGAGEIFGNFEVSDLKLTVTIDKDGYYSEITFDVSFVTDKYTRVTPEMSMVVTFSGFDSSFQEKGIIYDGDFTQVDDLRKLISLSNLLTVPKNGKDNHFSVKVEKESGGVTKTISENVTYGTKDGKFSYLITGNYEGKKVNIEYKDGEQSSGDNTVKMSDPYARAQIGKVMNVAGFSVNTVTGFEIVDKNTYKITIFRHEAADMAEMMSVGETYRSGSTVLTVTLS